MSIDLSDPSILSAREAITSPSNPTTWFLLQYNSPTNPSHLLLNSSGNDPVLPHLRRTIPTSTEDVLFGYASISGRGLVLVYLSDEVGGVRRARAIVHSRAVSQLFPSPSPFFVPILLGLAALALAKIPLSGPARVDVPIAPLSLRDLQDYSALITIAHPSQLTDELVRDRLGLDEGQEASGSRSGRGGGSGSREGEAGSVSRQGEAGGFRQGEAGPGSYQGETGGFRQRGASGSRQLRAELNQILLGEASESRPGELSGSQQLRGETSGYQFGETLRSAPPGDSNGARQHGLGGQRVTFVGEGPQAPSHLPRGSTPSLPPKSSTASLPSGAGEPNRTRTPVLARTTSNQSANYGDDRSPPRDMLATVPMFPAALGGSSPQIAVPLPPTSAIPSSRSQRSSSSVIEPDQPLELRGISSADYLREDRTRKVSLGARIEKALPFRSSASSTSPRTPPLPSSPESLKAQGQGSAFPAFGRFKASSFGKNFGRRQSFQTMSSGSPPNSPQMGEYGEIATAPQVPPKESRRRSGSSAQREGGAALGEPSLRPTPTHHVLNASDPPQDPSNGDVREPEPEAVAMSPSPSARIALNTVSQRTAAQENAIQERFRRDQEARHQTSTSRNREAVVVDAENEDDDDVRLPYDEPEPYQETNAEGWVGEGPPGQVNSSRISAPPSLPTPGVERGASAFPEGAVADGTARSVPAQSREMPGAYSSHGNENGQREAERLERERIYAEAATEGRERRASEERRRNRVEMERLQAERVEAERVERERVEAELVKARQAEEKLEAERLKARQAEERVEAERRLEAARLEKLRVEKQRLDAERVEAERRLKRVEQERLKAQAAEESRRRAESIRAHLRKGKAEGGMMLQGWVTVQTTKSTMWRRRWFHLHPGEMRLFKSEADTKPIQMIELGAGSSVSQTYEESQVQGSFKVASHGPSGEEEFFLFTDSPEDKETLLEGLALAKI